MTSRKEPVVTSVERPDTTRQRAVEAATKRIYGRPRRNVDARSAAEDVVDGTARVVLDDIEGRVRSLMPAAMCEHAASELEDVLAEIADLRERNGWSRD